MNIPNLRIEDISRVTRSMLEMLNIEPFNPKGEGMPVEFMDHGSPQEDKPVFCLPEDIEPYPNRELLVAAVNQALKEMTNKSQEREKARRDVELRAAAGKFAVLVAALNPLDLTVQELAEDVQEDQLGIHYRAGLITVGKLALELLERYYGERQQALTDLLG